MISKQNRQMASFYRQVSMLVRKNGGKVTLQELEKAWGKKADMVYSWMQWSDAKQWFMVSDANPTTYRLKAHLKGVGQAEINEQINNYYMRE